jgi:hypothetical protein
MIPVVQICIILIRIVHSAGLKDFYNLYFSSLSLFGDFQGSMAVLLMAWPDMEEIMPHMEGGNSTKQILQDKRISGMEKSQKKFSVFSDGYK